MCHRNASLLVLCAVTLLVLLAAAPLEANPLYKSPAIVTATGGSILNAIIVADVNRDGHGDLLVANGGLGVLLGMGNGHFGTVQTYGSGVASIAAGDVNGDGKIDVVASGSSVRVFLGNGDGTFETPQLIDPGSSYDSIALADVNGDGKLDVVASTQTTVGVWLGNGDGSFQAGKILTSGGGRVFALGDVNGDGHLDLVVLNSSGAGVLLGNGDGTFQVGQSFINTGGGGPVDIGLADLNLDGKLDMIVANSCSVGDCSVGAVGVLLGNGDGTFQPPLSYSSGAFGPVAMLIADANGDTRPDVLVVECTVKEYKCTKGGFVGAGNVGVLLSYNDGTLSTAQLVSSAGRDAVHVALGDIDGVGRADLVVGNLCAKGGGCDHIANVAVHLATK